MISHLFDTAISAKTSCTHAPENSDSAGNRSKIREEKILAYTKVREFSTTRNFKISRPLDEFSCGRSMVEMLGVLAIIGVLTVGGIAGYSKAIEQYRINKVVSEMTRIILELKPYSEEIGKSYGYIADISNILEALKVIPNSWKHFRGSLYQDELNNSIRITSYGEEGFNTYGKYMMYYNYFLRNQTPKTISSNNLCVALINNLVKPMSSSLYYFRISYSDTRYGKELCSPDRKCIKDLTMNEINNMCNVCLRSSECFISVGF